MTTENLWIQLGITLTKEGLRWALNKAVDWAIEELRKGY